MTISRKNRDVINAFNFSAMSFYGKGYYYHSQISWTTVIVKGSILDKY